MMRHIQLATLFLFLTASPAFAQLTESVWVCEDKILQRGEASVYSNYFHEHKKPTSNGETYNRNLFTAAHPDLGFGTMLEVEDLKTKKKVYVRVNDRGPFVKDRIIDITPAARAELGHEEDGVYNVAIRVCRLNETVMNTAKAAARRARPLLKPKH